MPQEARLRRRLQEPPCGFEDVLAQRSLTKRSREVEQLAEDYAAYFEKSPLPERLSRGVAWESGPLETALSGVALNAMSPAQKKCMELLQERLAEAGAER